MGLEKAKVTGGEHETGNAEEEAEGGCLSRDRLGNRTNLELLLKDDCDNQKILMIVAILTKLIPINRILEISCSTLVQQK
jgi:hypothetical protein